MKENMQLLLTDWWQRIKMAGKKIPRHWIYVTPEGFKVKLGTQENRGSRMAIIHPVSAQE